MSSHCFILASSDDRLHLLDKCVECAKNSKYADSDFYLYYQGTSPFHYGDFFKEILWDDRLRGVFTPRYKLLKKFGLRYDYTIIIDDDLFMRPDTSYENSMRFCELEPKAGAVSIIHNKNEVKPEIRCVSGTRQYFNISGGMVLPKRSVKIILDYFKDKEWDYTEDVIWLLLYVKGYDLYKDFSSSSMHMANRKGQNKELTGYNKMRVEKPHIPMLEEWFDSKKEYSETLGREVWKLKEMADINDAGILEREKNIFNLNKRRKHDSEKI